ncbi:hypothetical protein GUJ93_ZPchr0008g11468 [Zizania palustris]|uniref:Cullin family profile domain-containing protein n=1 Tax=Zizania palustris TaxID=103762 RepID=A0A8J5R9I2_ZIZPA|nr:hypothetical protein GUJ93_ZPchr0008g11468 [Zizania palustris]
MLKDRKLVLLDDGRRNLLAGVAQLKRILDGEEGSFSAEQYIHLYTAIYDMCTQASPHLYSQQLYELYKEVFDDHNRSTVLPSLMEKHGEFLLREFVQSWEKHKLMAKWLNRFFNYMDRFYVPQKRLDPLEEVGRKSFVELVFDKLKSRVTSMVIGVIDDEREGQLIDRALLKNVLQVYVEVGGTSIDFYNVDFEQPFLKGTADYYSKKAQTWNFDKTCPEYMIKAEECIQKEKERAASYLHSTTEPKLFEDALFELIIRHEEEIMNNENYGCRVLLCEEKTDDLARMFRLFSVVKDGVLPISRIFQEHVNKEGMSLLKHATDAASREKDEKEIVGLLEQGFVKNAIELHDKYIACITNCFQDKTVFHKAFEVFCNKDIAGCSSAELFAAYCDTIIRKGGSEKLSDEAVEEALDKVVKLLSYINDKDLFGEFYRKKLGKRLLFERNRNDEHEKMVLSKLKRFFGAVFTSKMEGMINDIALSKEHQSDFEEYISNNSELKSPVYLNVTVMTSGHWPNFKNYDINLPSDMVKYVEIFKVYYHSYKKQRKLTWIYSLGSCIVIGRFDAKPVELFLNTYQSALLLLFNEADRLSYSEIVTQLKLSDDDAVRVLHSLSCAKYKILNKEPSNISISPNDVFEFNSGFTPRSRRIKVPVPPAEEKKRVVEAVHKDRKCAIDASIVRIMKSRKVMSHQHLVSECLEQLNRTFKPDITAIKRSIESLIQKEYLRRDSETANTYRYVA